MKIEFHDVEKAAQQGLITAEQAKKLWVFLQNQSSDIASFRLTHLMYYFGGFLAISAITIFFTLGWDLLKGIPLLILSLSLFLLGISLTNYFLKNNLRLPAGILATFSLITVPLIVYNIQFLLGFLLQSPEGYQDFPYLINWYWTPMEITTLLAGVILFYIYRFPFLLFPISIVLWYMSMDLWPLLFNKIHYSWPEQALFSLLFGLLVLAIAVYMDFKDDEQEDYAFWLYISGVAAFWGGLTCLLYSSELAWFMYGLINILLLFISVFLYRRVFAIFGALGVLIYLGHLAYIFEMALLFPIVLIFMGILIIFAAAKWSHIEGKVITYLRPYLPKKVLRKIQ